MNEKRSDKVVVIIAVVMLAVILIGEAVVYTSNYTDYSAEASMSGGKISYKVSADGSKTYSVVISDNGDYDRIQKLVMYYDKSYPTDYAEVEADVGAPKLDQAYYLKQMKALLEFRGITDVSYANAAELKQILRESVDAGNAGGLGVLFISGVMPDTVYTGSSNDIIFEWLNAGGSLYWAANLIGCEYGKADGSIVAVDGYQNLFFGSECLNTDKDLNKAYSDYSGNTYREALSLSNNSVRYALDPSKISGRSVTALGYEEKGYASIASVQYGSGAVFVFGGDYSDYQRYDMTQVMASGLGPSSELVKHVKGTVARGTVTATVDLDGANVTDAYIYLGGYYPVYGKYIGF